MSEQVRKTKPQTTTKRPEAEAEVTAEKATTVDVEQLKDELDELLDEIDAVLETNAAEFVANYIQKGGQ